MALPDFYPKANRTAQYAPGKGGGGKQVTVEKLMLHTTESGGWPGYPTFMPHLTYNPWTHQWRQHFPLTQTASTLADPSSTPVRENRDNVIQVEMIGYCDPKYNVAGKGVDFYDDRAIRDLAEFAAWLHNEAGLELKFPFPFLRYPDSYGSRGGVRASSSEYDAARGIIGHEHASGNDHGDPGKPPWLDKFLAYSKEYAGITKTPEVKPVIVKEGVPLMADAKKIWQDAVLNQPLRGGDNQVWINADRDTSFVFGLNEGVSLVSVVEISLADPKGGGNVTEVEESFPKFFRLVAAKKGLKDETWHSRRATKGDTVHWNAPITGAPKDGRQLRLRLIVNVPESVAPVGELTNYVVHSVQSTGWEMP